MTTNIQSISNKTENSESNESTNNDENPTHSVDSLIRMREELLDLLIERSHDVNSFTRGAVLRVWSTLIENEAVPVSRLGSVAEVSVDRLCDKTAVVRKAAIALMTTLLDYNPFSGDLNTEHYKELKNKLETSISNRIEVIRSTTQPTKTINILNPKL